MYSVNVPVPGRVSRLAADVRPALAAFDRVRDRHTLVVKRLGEGPADRLQGRVREALAGVDPFECRVTGIEVFDDPPAGPAPVVYLAVDGPLRALHDRLTGVEPPVEGIEGPAYTPHVTIARGGPAEAADRLRGTALDERWTVSELLLWDGRYGEPAVRIGLPVAP